MERLYYVKDGSGGFRECPKPQKGAFEAISMLAKRIGKRVRSSACRMSVQRFVEHYSGSRRARYATAAGVMEKRSLRRKDGYTGVFIKAEFYNASTKPNPCTRLIQPRQSPYLLELGRFIKPIEKRIYKAIDELFGHHVVLKCDNPVQRGSTMAKYWSEFTDPCYIGFDASRFDQHVSASALRFEHMVYNTAYKNDPLLQRLLAWQVHNVGFGRTKEGYVKFSVDGARMSGDPNTALGNVIIMSLLCYSFLQGLGIKYRFIDDGDDCGVFVERHHKDLILGLVEHHLKYGFEMEVEPPAYSLEHAEFCQCRPINTGNGWVMIRNIWKALAQDTLHIDKQWATLDQQRTAIGICGLSLNRDIPIVGALYESMIGDVDKVVGRLVEERPGDFFNSVGASYGCIPPVEEATCRASVYTAFGALPDFQKAVEDELRGARSVHRLIKINSTNKPRIVSA